MLRGLTTVTYFAADVTAAQAWYTEMLGVEPLIERGLMTEHGQAMIDLARLTGTWQVVPDEAGSVLPADVQDLLDHDGDARRHFAAFPPSARRLILEWIGTARRPETRQRRIERTVALAAQNIRANHR